MSLTQPEIKVRSIVNKDGKRRWIVCQRSGLVSIPVGWPNHRIFHTWETAHSAADHYARNTKPRAT